MTGPDGAFDWIHDDGALLAVIISFLVAWLARGWVDRGLR